MTTSYSAIIADNLAQLFSILGDGTRMRILFLLRNTERTAQSLADELEMTHLPFPTISGCFAPISWSEAVKREEMSFILFRMTAVWNLLEAGASHLQHEDCAFSVEQ